MNAQSPTGSEVALTIAVLAVLLLVYVVFVVALWKVFAKAGRPGVLSLIPIVNVFVLVQIAGYSAWMTLLYLIPVVDVVFHVLVVLRLGRAFGKGAVFSLVWLWLLGPVGLLIIGFGSSRYSREAALGGI